MARMDLMAAANYQSKKKAVSNNIQGLHASYTFIIKQCLLRHGIFVFSCCCCARVFPGFPAASFLEKRTHKQTITCFFYEEQQQTTTAKNTMALAFCHKNNIIGSKKATNKNNRDDNNKHLPFQIPFIHIHIHGMEWHPLRAAQLNAQWSCASLWYCCCC